MTVFLSFYSSYCVINTTNNAYRMGCTSSSKLRERNKHSPNNSCSESSDKMSSQNFLSPIFPSVNSQQRISQQTTERKKVALRQGRSLMDWIRLGRSGKDLTGVGGKVQDVTMEQVAKHDKKDDAWMAIRGKVYNVTPYMEYHPGGEEELMRGVGKDGTQLFDEIHKWVNYESMLEKCFIGRLQLPSPLKKTDSDAKFKKPSLPNGSSPAAVKSPATPIPPKFDWYQSGSVVTLVVYTKWTHIKHEFVIIDKSDRVLLCTLHIEDFIYYLHIELEDDISSNYNVQVQNDTGKVEISLPKVQKDQQWKSIGKYLEKHNTYIKTKDKDVIYRKCTVDSVSPVTHDTKLFCISLPQHCRMCVPLGYHIYLRHVISGMEVIRSYTVVLPSLLKDQQNVQVSQGRVLYLMIKIYPDGVFTPWLDSLREGDTVEVSDFDGSFREAQLASCKELVLYAAGTGFTPMIGLLYQSLNQKLDRKVRLVFFNKTEKDILWKDQLDELSTLHDRLTVDYILSNPDETWSGRKGRISPDLVAEFTPNFKGDPKLLVCACGPTPFTNSILQMLKDLGYTEAQCHGFLA